MFDGAQVLRFARDLVFNAATENHLDAAVLPLRPGMLLMHESVARESLPAPLSRWDVIRYEWLDKPIEVSEDGVPFLASQSIGMNVLSLDERHVVVQDIQVPLIRDLEKHGFTPVPARWRHGRSLGGGFHCVTLDIRRDSTGDFAL